MGRASELFAAVPRQHNCAQAVMAGCGDPDRVADMADCGGGRAPGGLCGALHAAMLIRPDRAEALSRAFAEAVGDTTCRGIKTGPKTPCAVCVATAERLLSAL